MAEKGVFVTIEYLPIYIHTHNGWHHDRCASYCNKSIQIQWRGKSLLNGFCRNGWHCFSGHASRWKLNSGQIRGKEHPRSRRRECLLSCINQMTLKIAEAIPIHNVIGFSFLSFRSVANRVDSMCTQTSILCFCSCLSWPFFFFLFFFFLLLFSFIGWLLHLFICAMITQILHINAHACVRVSSISCIIA